MCVLCVCVFTTLKNECHLLTNYCDPDTVIYTYVSSFQSVDPEKEYICQGLLVVNSAQIRNQSLAAITDRGLPPTLYFRELPQAELPASCTVLLSE